MKSAIRSPIIMVVQLVLARTQLGIMDASATRSPCIPWTRPCWSTTDIGSDAGPILQVLVRCRPLTHVLADKVVQRLV